MHSPTVFSSTVSSDDAKHFNRNTYTLSGPTSSFAFSLEFRSFAPREDKALPPLPTLSPLPPLPTPTPRATMSSPSLPFADEEGWVRHTPADFEDAVSGVDVFEFLSAGELDPEYEENKVETRETRKESGSGRTSKRPHSVWRESSIAWGVSPSWEEEESLLVPADTMTLKSATTKSMKSGRGRSGSASSIESAKEKLSSFARASLHALHFGRRKGHRIARSVDSGR
ncbi:hypothetical protein CYLTODRAFT_490256 [Cylindrobasidium torrendii FP15055 ss-10]|uniref:Uncharacterized protein n=1 Tax=Cylindrobasidium torrendii FP15055 ss-10 TaxID=1314674 RepID=A0A0D7BBG0_9AGAR|nr:hypothetical protein CYLTODRAFT_490256 [Cylindrobasidium torrendii FP15055 ss-10]